MDVRAESEQPGGAWHLMGARSTAAVAVPLLALALLGWYFTIRQARDMSGMITGLDGSHRARFLAEKNWRHGALLTRVVGGEVAALGLAVAAVPSLLSAISN